MDCSIELISNLHLLDIEPHAWLEMWVIVFFRRDDLAPALHSMFSIFTTSEWKYGQMLLTKKEKKKRKEICANGVR